jgi:protein NrfD
MQNTSTLTKRSVQRRPVAPVQTEAFPSSSLVLALYIIGAVALIAGAWGIYTRLAYGERFVNYGSYVNWGLWVAMYLFFGGIAAGSAMVASLDYLFEVPLFRGTGRVALLTAVVTMPAALASIGMDLGHMERIWKVYLQPNFGSVMAQLVWGYTLFLILMLALLWLALSRPRQSGQTALVKVLMAAGLILSVFLSGGVGALLGVNASRAAWHSAFLPAQFPIFSLTSGAAAMLVVLAWLAPPSDLRRPRQLQVLGMALVVLLIVKAYYLWTEFSLSLYSGVPHSVEAANQVLFGRYGWAFWGVQVVLGMLIPTLVLTVPSLARRWYIAGLMGVLVLVGMAVARGNIIFPAMTIPELKGMEAAFTGPHLGYDYFPSAVEWSVTVGVIGGSILAFLLGSRWLRIHNQEQSSSEVA